MHSCLHTFVDTEKQTQAYTHTVCCTHTFCCSRLCRSYPCRVAHRYMQSCTHTHTHTYLLLPLSVGSMHAIHYISVNMISRPWGNVFQQWILDSGSELKHGGNFSESVRCKDRSMVMLPSDLSHYVWVEATSFHLALRLDTASLFCEQKRRKKQSFRRCSWHTGWGEGHHGPSHEAEQRVPHHSTTFKDETTKCRMPNRITMGDFQGSINIWKLVPRAAWTCATLAKWRNHCFDCAKALPRGMHSAQHHKKCWIYSHLPWGHVCVYWAGPRREHKTSIGRLL
jgi:hypothetical protein